MRKRIWLSLLLVATPLLGEPSPNLQKIVEKQVICQCGCTIELDRCPHLQCMVRSNMRNLIKDKIAGGASEAEVLAAVSAVYGRKAVARPPAEGAYLLVWALPVLALFTGGSFLVLFLRRASAAGSEAAWTADDES